MKAGKPRPSPSIIEAIDHPEIWRGWFKNPATWEPWRAFLGVLFGLPVSGGEATLFHTCTGRTALPQDGFNEAWLVCGRRAGKSFILALIACYLAVFRDWRPYLSPGEVGTIKVIATDRRQARVIHRYCRALLTQVPAFHDLVERDTDNELILTNGITIEVQTASFRTVRGYTVIAALCDEIAFWRSDEDAANPDSEILDALRPAMATIPGAFLLAASSPYARRGVLWEAFREHHGRDDAPALVWRAPTRTMNPTVPQSVVDRATERDPAHAAAEYDAQFRTDIESFISRDVVEAAVVQGRHELPRASGTVYRGFVDPSGAGSDSFTLAIAHRDRTGDVVLDLVRERRPPFSPEQVTNEFAVTLKSYCITKCVGDHYAGEWPKEQFRKSGVHYETSDKSKSEIYLETLPLLNSRRIELLDHQRLINQLCGLERRTARSGKDSIDHAPGGHDDICNAALGALLLASRAAGRMILPPEMLRQLQIAPRDRFTPNALGESRGSPGMPARNRFARAR